MRLNPEGVPPKTLYTYAIPCREGQGEGFHFSITPSLHHSIPLHHLKNQPASKLTTAPKLASAPIGFPASAKVPPKLINWCSASSAQPVGKQCATTFIAGGH